MDADKALDHAWRYFHLHAQQRITIFNYYVVLTGLLITGIATTLRELPQHAVLSAALGVLLTGLSFLFYKLDDRVSFLIKRAESVIGAHEPSGANLFGDEMGLTKSPTEKGQWSQGRVFRTMFLAVAATGVIVFLLSMFVIFAEPTGGEDVEVSSLMKKAVGDLENT